MTAEQAKARAYRKKQARKKEIKSTIIVGGVMLLSWSMVAALYIIDPDHKIWNRTVAAETTQATETATETEIETQPIHDLSNQGDSGTYDVVNYWETDDPDIYEVEFEYGKGTYTGYYEFLYEVPYDMAEVSFDWNGNEDDPANFTVQNCR